MESLLLASFILAFYVAWSIGANDESMAVVAGSGIGSITAVVAIGAIMDFMGALFFSGRVEHTLGKKIITFDLSIYDVLIVIAAMATWLIIASYRGWPISTTHSAVGAVIGLALIKDGLKGVRWRVLSNVALAWLLSPILGMLGSYLICMLIDTIMRHRLKGISMIFKVARFSSLIVLVWAMLTAFSKGGNDAANATAFLVTVYHDPFIVRLIGGTGMAIGLLILGRRVVRNVGNQLVELTPLTSLAVQISVATILFTGTMIGLPLSGTHILVGSVIGVGIARRVWMNIKGVKEIALTWIATFPGAALIAMALLMLSTMWPRIF